MANQYSRQYVTVKYYPNSRQSYTFYNDGRHVPVGEEVWVKSNTGPHKAEVVASTTFAPSERPSPDGWSGKRVQKIYRKA